MDTAPEVIGNDPSPVISIIRVHRDSEIGDPVGDIRQYQFTDRDIAATFIESLTHDKFIAKIEVYDQVAVFDREADANAVDIILPSAEDV